MVLNKTITEQMADRIASYKFELDGLTNKLQELEVINESLQEKQEQIENQFSDFRDASHDFETVEVFGGTLFYKVDTLLLLEVMEELTRVLQAGKSRTVINHLKSL